MGRKASHVALECALQSHPNMVRSSSYSCVNEFRRQLFCFLDEMHVCSFVMVNNQYIVHYQLILGEEVALSKLTIFDITKQICDAVQARAEKGCYTLFLYIHALLYSNKKKNLSREVSWCHSYS